jgi:NAD(P)-dependent dehydrogenase (short-subunit alcohol dehydrogenase family)
VYNASKFAVVGLSEALRGDLADTGIGVSVLCPGMVRTRILESERNRPAGFEPDSEAAEAAARAQAELMNRAMSTGIDAEEVGQLVLDGVREGRFWLFTHPEMKEMVAARAEEQLAAFGELSPERAAKLAELQAALGTGDPAS